MATILDVTQQGDVATIADDSRLTRTLKLMGPQQLYELWERQHWQSQTIDLERDKQGWARLGEEEKEQILWGLSSFFLGEERVTTQFSGLVMAYEDEQEEAFLTTQQVDEARHMQFFDRYYREVFGFADERIDERLERVREHVTDSFVKLFDEALVNAGQRLIENPRDIGAKVDFVTIYHMIIEGTLGLTGMHFLPDYFEKEGLLPGFVEGFGKIARDEHRHVAYGTWFLRQKTAQDADLKKRMQDKLSELLPIAAGMMAPPGYQLGDDYEFFGVTAQEQAEFAFTALTRRLKVLGAGLPVPAPA
jgi:ribonucleoside-diphosphate reductase beta chain